MTHHKTAARTLPQQDKKKTKKMFMSSCDLNILKGSTSTNVKMVKETRTVRTVFTFKAMLG